MIPTPDVANLPEWSVTELAGALRRTLEDRFAHVRLRGELGKVTRHSSGHVYLDIKDEGASIAGVLWRNAAARLKVKLEQGMEVVATGRITTFPNQSKYQIVIETIEPAGVGALMALLEERRKALAAEGLFATDRKRRLPMLPTVIGVVTSPTGAVIRDILHRLEDRFPRDVVLWPVRVQGETCGAEVAAAIAGFNALPAGGAIPRPDVIIVARGGGSVEDLWGFNDEAVVRAAAASEIPLVSAVGHETDWTLLDHVADLRAPTPTGAAEMVVPVRAELVSQVAALAGRAQDGVARGLDIRRQELRSAVRALPSVDALLAVARQRIDIAALRLAPALLANARNHETRLRRSGDALSRHSPRVGLATARERLAGWSGRLVAARDSLLRAERLRIEGARDRVGDLAGRAARAVDADLARRRAGLLAQAGLLASLGYRSVLERGYALVRSSDGRHIPRASGLAPGRAIEIEFADGVRRAIPEGAGPQPKGARKPSPYAQDTLFDM